MSKLTMIRQILSPFIFLNIVTRYKEKSSLMRIKAAQAYVVGVKKLRMLFLSIIFAMLSLLLLGSGLFLIHTGLFTYSAWSPQVKFIMSLALGGVEFLGAIIILFYLFREETWVKFYGIQTVLNSVVESTKSDRK